MTTFFLNGVRTSVRTSTFLSLVFLAGQEMAKVMPTTRARGLGRVHVTGAQGMGGGARGAQNETAPNLSSRD